MTSPVCSVHFENRSPISYLPISPPRSAELGLRRFQTKWHRDWTRAISRGMCVSFRSQRWSSRSWPVQTWWVSSTVGSIDFVFKSVNTWLSFLGTRQCATIHLEGSALAKYVIFGKCHEATNCWILFAIFSLLHALLVVVLASPNATNVWHRNLWGSIITYEPWVPWKCNTVNYCDAIPLPPFPPFLVFAHLPLRLACLQLVWA